MLFLLSMSGGAPQAAGRDTAADGIIRLAGGINAVDGYAGYRPLTPEAVIASRADFILVTRQTVEALGGIDKVLDQPALRQTPAGRAGKRPAVRHPAAAGLRSAHAAGRDRARRRAASRTGQGALSST